MASGTPIATLFASIGADLTPLKQGLAEGKTSLGEFGAATKATAQTWTEFVTGKMGPYMKEMGGHAEAMKRLSAEWKEYKASLAAAGDTATKAAPQLASAVTAATSGVRGATNAVDEHGKTTKTSLDMSRREWMRTGSEAAFYMTMMVGRSGELGRQLGGVAQVATQLGESFMFGGGVGAGIALVGVALSAIVSEANRTTPEVTKLNEALDGLGHKDDAARGLAQLSGATLEQARDALKAAAESDSYAKALKKLSEDAQKPIGVFELLGNAIGGVTKFMQSGIEAGRQLITMLIAGNAGMLAFIQSGGDMTAGQKAFRDSMVGSTEELKKRHDAEERLKNLVAKRAARELEHTRLTEFFKAAMRAAADEVRNYTAQLDSMAKAHDRTMAGFDTAWLEAERKAGIDRVKIGQDTAKTILKLNEDLGKRIGDINDSLGKRLKEMDYQRVEQLKQFAKDALGIEKDYTQGMRDAEKDKNKSIADLAKDTTKSLKALDKEKGKDLAETEKKRIKDLATLDLDHTKRMARAKSQVEREAEEQDYLDARAQIEQAAQERKAEIEEAAAEKRKQIEEAAAERRAEIEERFRERQAEIAAQRQERRDALAERKSDYDKQFEHEKSKAKEEADYTIAQAKRANGEQIQAARDREREQLEAIDTRLREEQRAINTRRDEENAAYESSKRAAWAAHLARMKAITDERDEAKKLADDIALLGADGKWKPFLDKWALVETKAKAVAGTIKSEFSDDSFKTTGETMTGKIGQGIDLGKGGLLTSVTDAIKYAVDLGTAPWQNAIEMIKAAGGWTIDRIKEGIAAATGLGLSITTQLSNAATGITTTATTLLRDLGALGGRVMAWVAGGLTDISSNIASSISGAANGIVDVIGGLSALGGRVMSWVAGGLTSIAGSIQSVITSSANSITSIVSGLGELGGRVMDWIRGASGIGSRVSDIATSMKNAITAGAYADWGATFNTNMYNTGKWVMDLLRGSGGIGAKVADLATSMRDTLTSAAYADWGSAFNTNMQNIGRWVADLMGGGVRQKVQDLASAMWDAWTRAIDWVKYWLGLGEQPRSLAAGSSLVSSLMTPTFNVPGFALGMPNAQTSGGASVASTPAGLTVNFYYQPQVSLATREEAEGILLPYIVEGVQDAQRRGLL